MLKIILIVFYIFLRFFDVQCPYPPIGDEIQAGSVVLPASRRGRYLANIVRRQAVDGTGIKFNKDADRMNAEAKKKVDVLSEELLPYIIAEQERRTTLYKRVMTALQNGEKGVTIAEIRNKPPVIIRKGLMYRCPTNRAPKEPDGSGVIMCEDNIEPTPIMYESCLSAEDKELYVADNKYFFCNRHKVEGPDLPRNGSTVIGCAPCERTSLNYTSSKCALEDTDDVVVHYRYYPDRTYKFVTELDPDREVCEHWNPCQIGYIFSLPSPDQATPASELWPDYKIVAEIPEDTLKEFVRPPLDYSTGHVKVPIPEGTTYSGVVRMTAGLGRTRISKREEVLPDRIEVMAVEADNTVKIRMHFTPMVDSDVSNYYASFLKDKKDNSRKSKKYEYKLLFSFERSNVRLIPKVEIAIPGQTLNTTQINYSCNHCTLKRIMLKSVAGTVNNIPTSKYRVHKVDEGNNLLEIDLDKLIFADFGVYFVFFDFNESGEEKVLALNVKYNLLGLQRLEDSWNPGEHFDGSINYKCADCDITDVFCRGDSQTKSGRVSIIPSNKIINFNFPNFDDSNACVYVAVFGKESKKYKKIVLVLEIISIIPSKLVVPPPLEGEQFEQEVGFKCGGNECAVDKVYINGVPLITSTRRSNVGSIPFYVVGDSTVTLRITQYVPEFEGVDQAVFLVDGTKITKTLMEIGFRPRYNNPDGRRAGITQEPDGSEEEDSGIESTSAAFPNETTTESLIKNLVAEETTIETEPEVSPSGITVVGNTTTESSDMKKKQ